MSIVIGSARHDENGKYKNGSAGDSLQKSSTNDTVGEVSMQTFYLHSKGWYVLRPKSTELADKIASAMILSCNNKNIGYDQNDRLGVIKYGIQTTTPTECDCSSLVRACVKYATGVDAGNFTTSNEVTILSNTGLFEKKFKYASGDKLYPGDVIVTCSQGHTCIVCYSDYKRNSVSISYYPACTVNSVSIVTCLKTVGENDTSLVNRAKIYKANGYTDSYTGSSIQNTKLVNLIKQGKLRKAN